MAASTRKKTFEVKRSVVLIIFCLFCLNDLSNCDSATENCIPGVETDMLKKFNPWPVVSEDRNITYKISICGTILPTFSKKNDCHSQTSVCMTLKGDNPRSAGNVSSIKQADNVLDGEFTVVFSGDHCPENPTSNLTTIITFKCAENLGSPEFVQYSMCNTMLIWRTSAACKGITRPVHEVPCYVMDHNSYKHNLSPLMKRTGGYLVDSSEGWKFYINICRDINGGSSDEGKTEQCPSGAGACRLNGDSHYDFGQPKDGLKISESGVLSLHYYTDTEVPGCIGKPSTTIEFRCPKIGGSKDPLLVADFNCQYRVLWETEHACSETDITSKTCKLVRPQDNINIDLTPLKQQRGDKHYEVFVPGKDNYRYFLNICGDLGIMCPDLAHVNHVAGCQTKSGTSAFGKVIGRDDSMLLRYADGDLSLTYYDGDICHTNAHRTTVINFECDPNTGGTGIGKPEFVEEVNNTCTYVFQWKTKYACTDHPSFEQCRVEYRGKRYDLSPLVRRKGTNWEALHSDNDDKHSRYFINVCNDLLNSGKEARCHPDSAVCLIDDEGIHNLGKYTTNPVHDTESNNLQITYSGGDACGGGKFKRSMVTFVCKPGDLESGPVLMDVTVDKCVYMFEWQTAAACVLSHSSGSNCRVFDKKAGFNFDLSPLTKTTGSYTVPSTNGTYDYVLNVCAAVQGTKCVNNPAVCQIKRNNQQQAINAGQPSSKLQYFDGMLNLTYTGGQNYNSDPPEARRTEIAFLCDPTVGKGKPTFLVEANHAYSFEWFTSFACPNEPVECVVEDEVRHQQYDLSGLTRTETQDNWQMVKDSGATRYKYYINVCRSLNQVSVGQGCGTFAAACRTKFIGGKEFVDQTMRDMGSVTSRPKIVSPGQLELRYKSKTKNCNDTTGKNFTVTSIHFFCRKGVLSAGPSDVEKLGNCEYVITWNTEAACPLEEIKSSKCEIKDRNSDYVFNLESLTKKGDQDYYTTTDEKNTFRLNVCGTISAAGCDKVENHLPSLCHVYPNGTREGLTFDPYTLDYSDDGKLLLKYEGKRSDDGHRITMEILFLCRQNIDLGVPKLNNIEEGRRYLFTFETSLACKPDLVECRTEDSHGNQYDLSPLARGASDVNWQVLDTRSTFKDTTYHINVCRPVNAITGSTCPGGPVGGCQVSNGGQSFNMGYIHSQPIAADDGTVTLHYRNGDICHRNTSRQSHRSTRIIFSCSGIEHNPIFQSETETCEYIFEWQTPYACRLNKATPGTNCKVHDPLNMYMFDLNGLRRTKDYHVIGGEYDFVLNMCGPLQKETCGASDGGIGVCQTKPKDPSFKIIAGKASSDLWYRSGEITLTYSDGKSNCHGKYNRSTVITFLCDQNNNGSQGPVFMNESSDCTYMFEWRTSLACPPFKVGDCTYKDGHGNEYDFSSLARTNQNYYEYDYVHKKKYILNVCRSLVHTKDETCPYNAAACEVNLAEVNNTKRFHNIGEVNEHMLREQTGVIEIYYSNGEMCEDGKNRMATRIMMYCDKDALMTQPTGHFQLNCLHHFVWYTPAACPINQQPSVVSGGNCNATNPRTGHMFDLNSLRKDSPYVVDDKRTHTFKLNVCGKVTGSKCTGNSVGVCQEETGGEKRSFNSGNYNAKLQYINGVLSLNYSGGAPCHNKQFTRTTIINFVCSEDAGNGQPVFIDETDDCTYYFSWHTRLVCEEKVKCSVETEKSTIDLSPLVKKAGFYMAVSDVSSADSAGKSFSSYYINICRPLNPIYGALCPPGASACIQRQNAKPQSLGSPKRPPYMERGKVVLEYGNGDSCANDVKKNMSTKIIFSCKKGASQGNPVLEEITSECQYVFLWDTDVVCEESSQVITPSDCVYSDPLTSEKYDFNILQKAIQPVFHNGLKYELSLCGPIQNHYPGCEGAAVCQVNKTLGTMYGHASQGKSNLRKTGGFLDMTYGGGYKCSGDRQSESMIGFECKATEIGKPEYTYVGPCLAQFSWKTCVVCPTVATCMVNHNFHDYDLYLLSSQTGGWNLTDAEGNRYWINICQAVHNGPTSQTQCPNMVAAWRKTPSGQVDSLGLVNTQKIIADDKSVTLKYSEGDVACSNGNRRSENPAAQTVITFECSNLVGGPEFIRVNQQTCVFEFHWKSKVACRVQRQSVMDKNGTLEDPETQSKVNLNSLKPVSVKVGDITYKIDMQGKASGCSDSVVCLLQNTKVPTNVGAFSQRKFYFEDGRFEAVYTSAVSCSRDSSKKIQTIIKFTCSSVQKNPQVLSESKDCNHLFEWQTPVACLKPNVVVPQPKDKSSLSSGGHQGTKPKTVAIVIAVFSAAIILCVLLIVFHKKERRDSFKAKLGCLVNRGQERYRYSQLPEIEDGDDDAILDAANNLMPDEPTESVPINVSTVQSYHDDSDVDLLE